MTDDIQPNEDGTVPIYIGNQPKMNYVIVAWNVLQKGGICVIKARGRHISAAVDVAEILTKKFAKDAKYLDIKLDTEQLTNVKGSISNVSSIEIKIGYEDQGKGDSE